MLYYIKSEKQLEKEGWLLDYMWGLYRHPIFSRISTVPPEYCGKIIEGKHIVLVKEKEEYIEFVQDSIKWHIPVEATTILETKLAKILYC